MLRDITEEKSAGAGIITGQYLAQLINTYHRSKKTEASKWYQITHRTSAWMQSIENFFNTVLRRKMGDLTHEECFALAKVAFLDQHKLGAKSRIAKSNLLQHYNLSVISALFASEGCVNSLHDYFKTMCNSPNDAANVSYAVLALKNIDEIAIKLGICNTIYARKLLEEIKLNGAIASYFVNNLQQVQKNLPFIFSIYPDEENTNATDELIRKDRILFILTRLKQANEFTADSIKNTLTLSTKQLMRIASQVDAYKDESPTKIIKQIASPKKLSPSLFESIPGEDKKNEHREAIPKPY